MNFKKMKYKIGIDLNSFIKSKHKYEFSISDEDIRFFMENPELLDDLTDKKKIYYKFLLIAFFTGLALVIISKVIAYYPVFDEFVNELITDLVFEAGVAMWGGVATSFIIEVMQKKQYSENLALKKEILRRISLLENTEDLKK